MQFRRRLGSTAIPTPRSRQPPASVQQQQRAPSGQVQTSSLPPPSGQPAGDHAGERRVRRWPRDGVLPSGAGVRSGNDRLRAGAAAAQSPHALPPPVRQSKAPAGQDRAHATDVHVVAPGETLIAISRKYNMPLAELARLNNIPPHTKVNIGDRITIPASRATARATQPEQKVAAQPKSLSAPKAKAEPKTAALPKAQPKADPVLASHQPAETASVATPSRSAGRHQFGPRRQRQPVVPLAGEGPHHRGLRSEDQRPDQRRHQHRAAGRHADQGGGRRRRRLCRQRAQGLRQSRAGAPRRRLRDRLRARQGTAGQARRPDQARADHRALRARPATSTRRSCTSRSARVRRRSIRCRT